LKQGAFGPECRTCGPAEKQIDLGAWDSIKITPLQGNSAEITVQFFAQRLVAQEGAAPFGGEYGMNEDFCERLCHGAKWARTGLMQSFQD